MRMQIIAKALFLSGLVLLARSFRTVRSASRHERAVDELKAECVPQCHHSTGAYDPAHWCAWSEDSCVSACFGIWKEGCGDDPPAPTPSPPQAATILRPGDHSNRQAYVHALSNTNRFCPTRCPSEIVQPENAAQLAAWIRGNQDKSFVVKGGGHSYACQSVPMDGGVLIHTEQMNGIQVFRRPDGSAYVRAGAGLTFDQLVPRLAKVNYSMPHGECLTVGLAGWALNVGNHPELKNFDNKWGYDGKGFINKITMVSYAGSIFTVDKDGIDLVELGNESLTGWQARAFLTETTGLGIDYFSPEMSSSGPCMKVFKLFGANLAIATEFEIELIPKKEPGFFQVTYGVNDVLDDKGGRGAKLMKAIVDVVANAGTDPDLDCGIFYASDYYKGTKEGVVALKCTDWVSETGETIAKYAPPGYRELEPKKSGFAFWALNSYGKGWIPSWHVEDLAIFLEKNGAEKYREFLRAMEEGDELGPNPCDECTSELMYMSKPSTTENFMFDNFCVGRPANQDICSAFVFRSKGRFVDDRADTPGAVTYKQNLPDCKADPDWRSNMVEYGAGGGAAWFAGAALKAAWDGGAKVKFWAGLAERDDLPNAATCEAAQVQPAGATCVQNGITAEDLAKAELAKVDQKCPAHKSYANYDDQNSLCSSYIYDVAELPSMTDVSE